MAEFMEAASSLTFGIWFLVGTAMVFFMQCGFAMVEAGFTRAKNAGNIIMKNLMDFCIGSVVFVTLGSGLMLAEDYIAGVIGMPNLDIFTNWDNYNWSSFVFNLVFCATAATIVSGAMAERTKFSAYCIYSAVISAVVYPIEAGWVWNTQGWLYKLGFIDYASSAAIHMVGGTAALIGAIFLGPRIGKYVTKADGKKEARAIPGHSITIGSLGVFILWFAWYGFNGAVAVHFGNGIWGTLAVGLFATDGGLFYGGFRQLGVQALGVVSILAYTIVMMIITFALIKKSHGLRVSPEEEIAGLDSVEHGLASAYAGFEFSADPTLADIVPAPATPAVPVEAAVPVEVKSSSAPENTGKKITKVEIICKESRFEALKAAMDAVGITGMTVTKVLGCGIQKGKTGYYRGVKIESMDLNPKVQVDIVVSAVPVRTLIEAAKKALYTGSIGDGKIFVYDVENVVKVRTGEEGYDALQGDEQF